MKRKVWEYAIWLLVLMLGISTARNVARVRRVRAEIEKEQGKIAKMKRENEEFGKRVTEAQSLEFVESEIRNKLGFAKEGETIVILPDKETLKKLAPRLGIEEDTLPNPNWKRWLKLFL